MEDLIKDFVLPLATFILGVLFTMIWDKNKKNSEKYQSCANRLSELTNDWYNQLYNLNSEKKFNSKNFEKELFLYSQNRIVLPEYLKIITNLKKKKKYSKLVDKAESFLELITDYDRNDHMVPQCVFCHEAPFQDKMSKENTLSDLDILLQDIAIEVGKS